MTAGKLSIKGMMCGNCQAHVESTLNKLEGVEAVNVSLEGESAKFNYNESTTNLEAIKAAFEDSNYEVA